jgi:hypothetical protein
MKKFVVVLVLLVIMVFSVSAQTGFFVGGKLGFGRGFHSVSDTQKASYAGFDDSSTWAFTFGAVAGYTFMPKLSVVSGLDFYFNQGVKFKQGGFEDKYTYSSVDIPVLIRYEFVQNLEDHINIGVEGGLYLSVPLDVKNVENPGSSYTFESDGINPGITAGLVGSYALGPGRITAGLHLLIDFSPVEMSFPFLGTEELLTRRELILSVGYEYSL